MTPRQLEAFVAVARSSSFARACEALHLSPPALSLAIKTLEQSHGGRLFSRTTREVRLTPEGVILLPRAQQLLADWEGLRQQLHARFTLHDGNLTTAAIPSFAGNVLPRLLLDYRNRYPNVAVTVHDVVNEDVVQMVRSGRVELGFAFEPRAEGSLAFEPLSTDRFVAIVPARSELSKLKTVTWSQLLREVFIALQSPSLLRRMFEEALAEANVELRISLEVHQLATVGEFVAAGLGVSVVPSYCSEQMTAMGAVCLKLRQPVIGKVIGMLTRSDQELSTAANAMRSAAREALSKD